MRNLTDEWLTQVLGAEQTEKLGNRKTLFWHDSYEQRRETLCQRAKRYDGYKKYKAGNRLSDKKRKGEPND